MNPDSMSLLTGKMAERLAPKGPPRLRLSASLPSREDAAVDWLDERLWVLSPGVKPTGALVLQLQTKPLAEIVTGITDTLEDWNDWVIAGHPACLRSRRPL